MHERLCSLVNDLFLTQGLSSTKDVAYSKGQIDVFCNGIYYEVKSNIHSKSYLKAQNQIKRAMRYKQCDYGYLVTQQGVYDVMKDLVIRK
jgi:hypothetical protein